MQEIQFLEFMGGSNVQQAFPNYLVCLCFIRISTVCMFWNSKQHETALLEFIVTSQFHCMHAITTILLQDQENPSGRELPLSTLRNLLYRALRVLAQGQIYHFCNGGTLIQFI